MRAPGHGVFSDTYWVSNTSLQSFSHPNTLRLPGCSWHLHGALRFPHMVLPWPEQPTEEMVAQSITL